MDCGAIAGQQQHQWWNRDDLGAQPKIPVPPWIRLNPDPGARNLEMERRAIRLHVVCLPRRCILVGIADLWLDKASVRVFGQVSFPTDCNHASITYTFEGFEGMLAPDQMTGNTIMYETGIGGETRAPLLVPTL
jgi:hypothetical protein